MRSPSFFVVSKRQKASTLLRRQSDCKVGSRGLGAQPSDKHLGPVRTGALLAKKLKNSFDTEASGRVKATKGSE